MNGPKHYAEAETLLKEAHDTEAGSANEAYYVGAAQVHATLALAAAQIDTANRRVTVTDWSNVLGTEPPADLCDASEQCTASSHMLRCPSVTGSPS